MTNVVRLKTPEKKEAAEVRPFPRRRALRLRPMLFFIVVFILALAWQAPLNTFALQFLTRTDLPIGYSTASVQGESIVLNNVSLRDVPFALERLEITPSYLWLLSGRARATVETRLFGGSVSGPVHYNLFSSRLRADLAFERLQMRAMPFLHTEPVNTLLVQPTGRIGGTASFALTPNGTPEGFTASLTAENINALLRGTEMPVMLDRVRAEITQEGNLIHLALTSEAINGTAQVNILGDRPVEGTFNAHMPPLVKGDLTLSGTLTRPRLKLEPQPAP